MDLNFQELVGKRVKLTPLNNHHIEGLYQAGNYPEIWPYMFMKVEKLDDMKKIVEEALINMKKGIEFTYTIIDKENEKIIGSTRLYDYSSTHKQIEIGSSWVTPSVWGSLLNIETKYLLLKQCFEEHKLIRVQLKTDGRNIRSQKAIEKIGGKKEGVLRKHRILPFDNYIRDTVMYSVLDEEWVVVKQRLEDMLR